MAEIIVIGYQFCEIGTDAHMIVDPLPQTIDYFQKKYGIEVPPDGGYINIPVDCPQCKEERRQYLYRELEMADLCCDDQAITDLSGEIRSLK